MMPLAKIMKGVRFRSVRKIGNIRIHKVTDDSRKVAPGDLFIAVRGTAKDGSEFIQNAIRSGAKAIVAESDFDAPKSIVKIIVDDARAALSVIAANYFSDPSRKLKVVGITGTNGKTTITYLIEGIIKASRAHAGVIGTINYRIKGKAVPAKNTTPGPIELQGILHATVKARAAYAVMEVSSHSLDQGRVDRVSFDVAIFTNITSDHLDYHKTPANYFKAKKRLFEKLKSRGTAVLNIDDKKIAVFARSIAAKALTYSVKGNAAVSAENVKLSVDGTTFTVATPKGTFGIRTKLIGIHNVSNILAAVAAAIALKIPCEAIVKGIESVISVPGRLERVDGGQPFRVFVDFAHTEDALLNVLRLLKQVAEKRIVTVFGCGGNRDRTKRPAMGKVACVYSDHVIVTSDNPRFEEPREIIDEIEKGIRQTHSNYDIVPDRKDAIARAFRGAVSGDIVVIAGKGHENYQIIKDRVMPFDDREIALGILKGQYEG